MDKLGKIIAIGLGFVVLAMSLTLTLDHRVGAAGPPGGFDVTVTNTPLPVTSTISGTPTVNVGNFPSTQPVSISDTLSVAEAGVPFATELGATLSGPGPDSTYLVSSANHLIIEYVSGTCSLFGGDTGSAKLTTIGLILVTSGQGEHFYTANLQDLNVGAHQATDFSFAQQVRLYADPSTAVTAALNGGGGGDGRVLCAIEISGRLTTP